MLIDQEVLYIFSITMEFHHPSTSTYSNYLQIEGEYKNDIFFPIF